MSGYKYKVWNDGTNCACWCFLSITKGDRVITEKEFIPPPFIKTLFASTNKVIEANLAKGAAIAKERIAILEEGEDMNPALAIQSSEESDLNQIMEMVKSKGMRGVHATKWYADIKVIIDLRLEELSKRSAR